MKTLVRAITGLLIDVLLVISALLLRRSRSSVLCASGDLTQSVTPEAAAKVLGSGDFSWLRHARVCDIGPYLVASSLEGEGQPLVVLRKGTELRTLFAATSNSTGLFDPDKKRGFRGLLV